MNAPTTEPDRIVVVNDLSQPKGGASQLAIESARAFAVRGHAVTLLCGDGGNPDLAAQGIEVVALGQQRLLAGNPVTTAVRGLWNRAARDMVGGWIAANDTPGTVYHVHGWSQILTSAVFAALAPVAARTLGTAHDFFLTCPNGAMFHFPRGEPCALRPMSAACMASACDRRGRAAKLWRVARQAVQDRVLAQAGRPPQMLIHTAMAGYLRRAGLADAEMAVLPNPVVPFAQPRVAAERNADVLFVGRIEATKGIDLAAEACRRARVRLVAAGDGDLLGEMRARYPEMAWHGRCDRGELAKLARAARMLVMPSRHMEPFGLSAVEALWSGLPVIASAHALIAGEIVEAGAGLAVDPHDIDALARAIATIAGDDMLTRRMSERATYETGHLALPPERWIDALLASYAALLSGGPQAIGPAVARARAATGKSRAAFPVAATDSGVS